MAIGTPGNAVTSSTSGSEASIDVTLPTHDEGDLLMIGVGFDDGSISALGLPSGWTELQGDYFASDIVIKVIAKIAGASEPSTVNIALTDDSERGTAIAHRVPGAALPTQDSIATGDGSTASSTALTPTTSTNKVIFYGFTKDDSTSHTMSGLTKLGDVGYTSGATCSAFWMTHNTTNEIVSYDLTLGVSDKWIMMAVIVPEAQTTDDCEADGVKTTPEVGAPSVGQNHSLTPTGVKTTPEVDSPSVGQTHNLVADSIQVTPEVDQPTIGQKHILVSDAIEAWSYLEKEGEPVVGQLHNLVADSIQVTPEVDQPTIGQKHILVADGIEATPQVGSPTVSTGDSADARGVQTTPEVSSPSVGQNHILGPQGVVTTPETSQPTASEKHVLDPAGVRTTPEVGSPTVGQVHILSAGAIQTTPEVGTPFAFEGVKDNCEADGIQTTPEVGSPSVGQIHTLLAEGVETTPEVGIPTLNQIAILDAVGVSSAPSVGQPTVSQKHVLVADGIASTPEVGIPAVVFIALGIMSARCSIVYPSYSADVSRFMMEPTTILMDANFTSMED